MITVDRVDEITITIALQAPIDDVEVKLDSKGNRLPLLSKLDQLTLR